MWRELEQILSNKSAQCTREKVSVRMDDNRSTWIFTRNSVQCHFNTFFYSLLLCWSTLLLQGFSVLPGTRTLIQNPLNPVVVYIFTSLSPRSDLMWAESREKGFWISCNTYIIKAFWSVVQRHPEEPDIICNF